MGFTTTTFFFIFLPLVLLFYFIFYSYMAKRESCLIGNIILGASSFVFYAWALATNAVKLLVYALIIFFIGRIIEKSKAEKNSADITVSLQGKNGDKGKKYALVALLAGLILALFILYHYKYSATIASFLSSFLPINITNSKSIIAPLGISFITFSAISYLADIYRSDATGGNFFDCILYIFFFPKVASGPIVPWKDFQPQIKFRSVTSGGFVEGVNRIAIGFAKKVILADTFGLYANGIQSVPIDTATAWFGWLLYAMQIYFDFSGYSDIAIGLAKIFGFEFAENFSFPYTSTSITEFWRKWHISLGAFFRNYVYIPLGGNRKGKARTLINLAIVFVITGVWHGAGLAYIVWGAIHGLCTVVERVIKDKDWYKRIPAVLKWACTFFIVACAWQFFRYNGDFYGAIESIVRLFGIRPYAASEILFPFKYYLDGKIITLLIIGFAGATLLGNEKVQSFYQKIKINYAFYIAQEIFILAVLILSIVFMTSSTYSPFIYFQF